MDLEVGALREGTDSMEQGDRRSGYPAVRRVAGFPSALHSKVVVYAGTRPPGRIVFNSRRTSTVTYAVVRSGPENSEVGHRAP
jgi:hypothetical protein